MMMVAVPEYLVFLHLSLSFLKILDANCFLSVYDHRHIFWERSEWIGLFMKYTVYVFSSAGAHVAWWRINLPSYRDRQRQYTFIQYSFMRCEWFSTLYVICKIWLDVRFHVVSKTQLCFVASLSVITSMLVFVFFQYVSIFFLKI